MKGFSKFSFSFNCIFFFWKRWTTNLCLHSDHQVAGNNFSQFSLCKYFLSNVLCYANLFITKPNRKYKKYIYWKKKTKTKNHEFKFKCSADQWKIINNWKPWVRRVHKMVQTDGHKWTDGRTAGHWTDQIF